MKLSDLSPADRLELLKSLRIEADVETTEVYSGGFSGDGSALYQERHTVKIRLVADIDEERHDISEAEFDL